MEKKHKEKLCNLMARLEADAAIQANSYCCFAPKLRSYVSDEDFKRRLNELSPDEKEKVLELQKRQKVEEESCAKDYNEALSRMNEHHHDRQLETLKKILEETQKNAMMELKNAQEKEMTELSSHQTRSSVLSTKEISSDKTVKRAEKDRRIREMKSSNVKKFLEERQMVTSKHNRLLEDIERDQTAEADIVIEAIQEYIQKQKQEYCFNKTLRCKSANGIQRSEILTENNASENVFFDLGGKSDTGTD